MSLKEGDEFIDERTKRVYRVYYSATTQALAIPCPCGCIMPQDAEAYIGRRQYRLRTPFEQLIEEVLDEEVLDECK